MPGRPRRQYTSFRGGGQGTPRRRPAASRGSAARTRPPARRPDPHAGLDQALAAAAAAPQPEAATFGALGVDDRLVSALATGGIREPFAIQARVLPDALAGRSVLGRAQTGSGKTLAFGLPLLTRLAASDAPRQQQTPRALILVPTRELAQQVADVLAPLGRRVGVSTATVYGGVSIRRQIDRVRDADLVVATPGRLIDLMERGACRLGGIEITVLDEADHMADLGFLPAVRRLLAATPTDGQRMLFSATLDRAGDGLVRQFLSNPAVHQADTSAPTVNTMTHHLLHLERADRLAVLLNLTSAPGRTIVFTRTKHGAKALTRQLNQNGVSAVELHGNLTQNNRTRNLDDFHSGRASALVATDIAARGIHVDDVALVVHADPPADHKAYLHRSGRTARAGNSGIVVTLMTTDQVREVQRLTKQAQITARTTRIAAADHAVLAKLVPGPRTARTPRPVTSSVERSAPHRPQRVTSHTAGRSRSGPGRRGARRGAPVHARRSA